VDESAHHDFFDDELQHINQPGVKIINLWETRTAALYHLMAVVSMPIGHLHSSWLRHCKEERFLGISRLESF
jgi:hypothetical protein